MAEFTGFNEVICHLWIDEVRGLRCCLAQGQPGSCSAVHPQRLPPNHHPLPPAAGGPHPAPQGDLT